MRLLTALLVAMLSGACGQTHSSAPPPVAEAVSLQGRYRAASDSALTLTGDLAIERGGLMFANGVVLYTRTLNPRRGLDITARNGESYAAIAVGPAELAVELRHVNEQVVAPGVRSLCGEDTPSYVALAYEERATSVTLMVFAGEEPPSPEATQSRLCGTYAYTAPDGARTRQGVVLR